jgi:hypothetical protein
MLRAVLLGVLSLTVVSCKSKDESPKSQVGVAAGSVIEASGNVTLHRGAEARPLAKGETVEGDDVIETGADGSVQIELAHNNAMWELGANKKVKVRESLAWNEAKKDKSAKAVEQDSAAAGRHAERNAADTTVSSAPAATPTMPESAAAPAPAAAPEAKQDMDLKQEKKKAAPPPAPPRAAAAPQVQPPAAAPTVQPPAAAVAPPPPPPKTAAPPPPAKTAAPPPPPKTVTRSRSTDTFSGGGSLGLTGTGEGGGGAGDGIGMGGAGGKIGGGTSAMSDARAKINDHLGDLKKCFKDTTKVTFKIDPQGRATLAYGKSVDTATQECVERVVKTIEFASSQTAVTIEIKP